MNNYKEIYNLKNLKRHYNKEEIVNSYETLRFSNLAGKIEHEITLDLINFLIKMHKPALLLEIATGPGRISKDIKLFSRGIGIDFSENMLKLAKKNVSGNWKFIKADINKMPFKENYFDMVISFRLLIHFNNKQRQNTYKKIKKILKSKGIFVFDVGNKDYKKPNLINLLLMFYRLFKKENENKLLPKIYNNPAKINQLVKELKENNFNIMQIYGVNYYNSLVLLLLSLSKRLRFLSNFIKHIILKIERINQNKLKSYATFIVVAKNEKN